MFRKLGFDYFLFFSENGKLATYESSIIAFVVGAVNKKNLGQSTELPVTHVKVPVTTFFRNTRENF